MRKIHTLQYSQSRDSKAGLEQGVGRKQGTPGRSCHGIHDEEWGTTPSLPARALSSEEEQVRAILPDKSSGRREFI